MRKRKQTSRIHKKTIKPNEITETVASVVLIGISNKYQLTDFVTVKHNRVLTKCWNKIIIYTYITHRTLSVVVASVVIIFLLFQTKNFILFLESKLLARICLHKLQINFRISRIYKVCSSICLITHSYFVCLQNRLKNDKKKFATDTCSMGRLLAFIFKVDSLFLCIFATCLYSNGILQRCSFNWHQLKLLHDYIRFGLQ